MRSVLLIAMVCLIAVPFAAGQETVFRGPIENGGYGGPVVKFGQVQDKSAVWVGGKGGWLINHVLMLGGGGYGLVTDIAEEDNVIWPTRRLEVGYGGFVMEYIHKPNRLVHFTFEALIGAGGATYRYHDDDVFWGDTYTDAFFAFEPGMNIELNFTENIRAAAGFSYLYTSGLELNDIEDSDLTGAMGQIILKFGKF